MRMRQFIGMGVVTTTLAASIAQAAFSVPRNGVTWDATFEGDVAALTASTPAWAVFDVANSNGASSDGDIRSYTTGNEAGANSYEFTGATWTGTGAARTAEIRLRVPNNAQYEAADGQGSFILGMDEAYDFRFFDDHIAYNVGGDLVTNTVALDTSVFHIYRVTVDQGANPQVNLYIDGNTTPALSTNQEWFTSAGFDKLVYGDISTGGEAGMMDVDYISWAVGVHPPVPEPASMALLAMGTLALRRRR